MKMLQDDISMMRLKLLSASHSGKSVNKLMKIKLTMPLWLLKIQLPGAFFKTIH